MRTARRLSLLAALLLSWVLPGSTSAHAQHGGGAHGGGMSGSGGRRPGAGFGGGGFAPGNDRNGGAPGNSPDSAGTVSTTRGGLQLGPPGRWWDDKHFARDLKLRPDQQRRMDDIFEANRAALTHRLDDVHQEESRLASLVRSHANDEASLDLQIERRSQARADLEKAYTHYLLQLRNEMDADQLGRLEEHR